MSTRALALIALALAALLAGLAGLVCDRLGYLQELERASFVFTNHTLGVERGQRVVVRPIRSDATSLRYTFTGAIVEPQQGAALFPQPYAVGGMEDREADEDTWYFKDRAFFLFSQLGAMTPKEWLEEITPVRERTADGKERVLIRARFGHENGSQILYLFDPEKPVPVFGWFRHELYAEGRDPQIYFARAAGKVVIE